MFAGQPLTKQVSHSLITPSNLNEYTQFFKQNSYREDGWADVKIDKEATWRRMWFIFDDGILKYGSGPQAPLSSFASIPMDNVMSLRADSSHGDATIQIITSAHKFRLRLENLNEMNRWLFCFQKSVALVLSHLTQAAEQQAQTGTSPYYDADQSDRRSPNNNPRSVLASPSKNSGKNPAHSHSFADNGSGTASPALNPEDVYAAFRRNDERNAGRGEVRRTSLHGLPSDSSTGFDFRSGSSAIPISAPTNGTNGHHHHHHHPHHHAHSHHSSHSHAASHGAQQAHSHHSTRQRSTSGAERLSASSTDRMATSFKEEDEEHLRLEELLQTPSDGSRSRADSQVSEDFHSDSSEEGDADWRSRGSNELQDDDEDDLMFDLDETAETRHSTTSESRAPLSGGAGGGYSSHSGSSRPATRNHSTESTGQDSFYSMGKALSLSVALADPDHKSPSRRSSHTNMVVPLQALQGQGQGSQPGKSPSQKTSPKTHAAHSSSTGGSAGYGNMSRANHSDYLMWESGFCSSRGIRDSQEDRFSCLPNINDHLSGGAGVPSSSGATSSSTTSPTAATASASALSSVFASVSLAQPSAPVSVHGLGGGVDGAGGYFGVYDGHGGQAAAVFLEKYLLGNICQHPLFSSDLAAAVSDSCKRTDRDFLTECDAKKIYCGTTALGAFVLGAQLLVFSIGDCQAVLCTDGVAVEMNDPHKPGRDDETARIHRAGGWITEEKELFFGRMHRMDLSDPLVRDKAKQVTTWATIHRVCGEISVSRSIGDPDYKRFTPGQPVNAFFSWPAAHNQVFEADLLIPDPECRAHALGPLDEFLVLASDGLWDVVSPDDAVTMIRAAFENDKSPSEAADDLCELAVKLGSSDNVTVVITRFMHSTNTSTSS